MSLLVGKSVFVVVSYDSIHVEVFETFSVSHLAGFVANLLFGCPLGTTQALFGKSSV